MGIGGITPALKNEFATLINLRIARNAILIFLI